jgi:hypothetical protein
MTRPRSGRPRHPGSRRDCDRVSNASLTTHFEMSHGLSCNFGPLTRLLPTPTSGDRQAHPGDPSPSLRPHYGASPVLRCGPPLRPTPVLDPLQFPLLGALPSTRPVQHPTGTAGATGSDVPCRCPIRARATSAPVTTWPVSRHPPGSSQGNNGTPVSMTSVRFRCFNSGSLSFAFSDYT